MPDHRDPASRIVRWQQQHGRHALPWQTRDLYRIWISEIMLQQTQATTVIPYFQRFLKRFPDLAALARAPLDDVLHAWAGLGYYARARNLHRCARVLMDTWQGAFPRSAAELSTLPGIGPSTAAAIAAFAWGERAPILDGNVRRVLVRFHALEGDPGTAAATRQLWAWAHEWLEQAPAGLDMAAYTQGQMDLGALICTRHQPACAQCPLASDCVAYQTGRQAVLPAPRKRPAVPQRACTWLIATWNGHLLLQRRPEHGIWGGLWSVPEFDHLRALRAACAPLWGSADGRLAALPPLTHTFTHFRLRMRPYRTALPPTPAPTPLPDSQWVAREALRTRGLPAPLTRLLDDLDDLWSTTA